MSNNTRYSFIPWMRQGIANSINEADGSATAKVRASFNVRLKINDSTNTDTLKINLIGPGDIVGMNKKAVVKTEPHNWITDFEPNYLPHIEFYDEDFPWRYTPAKGNTTNHKLRPWLTLVVLKEDEFEDNGIPGPLESFKLKGKIGSDLFPAADQLWAWAHIHVNEDLSTADTNNLNNAKNSLTSKLIADPDIAYSRLICPRKLEPNTAYHAFLIPSFETGRLAGLGFDIDPNIVATESAWSGPQDTYPIYHRWYFRTAEAGDFEFLVRQLKPLPADKRVGIRDMDVTNPGSNLPGLADPEVLGLEGALKAPQTESTLWPASYPDTLQSNLAERINLSYTYQQTEPASDPIITPPIYARWHALSEQVTVPNNVNELKWVNELNLDPRNRTTAGFGTVVIQKNQEKLMDSAWQQLGNVLDANQKIKWLQFARIVSLKTYQKFITPLKEVLLLSFTSVLHQKILTHSKTAFFHISNSKLQNTVLTPVFRKIYRKRGVISSRLTSSDEKFEHDNLITRINQGEITPAKPKEQPSGSANNSDISKTVKPKGVPGFIIKLFTKWWIAYLPLFILILVVILAVIFKANIAGMKWLAVLILILIAISTYFIRWWKAINEYKLPKEEELTAAAVDDLPKYEEFKFTEPGTKINLKASKEDRGNSWAFKNALKDMHSLFELSPPPEKEKDPLNIAALNADIIATIHPYTSIYKRSRSVLKIPDEYALWQPEYIKPVMAYPEFDTPMYEPLRDISTELLVPNLNLIKQNSVTLLETNQKFIESYMVGLNHEMARELLWREYLTDQRGSYFRQFWDVSGFVNLDTSKSDEDLKEELRDVKPIHTWLKSTELGEHNNRESGGDDSQLVLVIRGDLLKKYPNTVIYAQRAKWQTKKVGGIDKIDNSKSRILTDIDETSQSDLKFPLYGAKVEPDLTFIGFDLTPEQAKGENGDTEGDDPGWFFVIEERVGEPRFGLDVVKEGDSTPKLNSWNDLTWNHVSVNTAKNIQLGSTVNLEAGAENPENVKWSNTSNAADLAYILFQLPVRVGVHSSELLKDI